MSSDYVCIAFAVPTSLKWEDFKKKALTAINSLQISDLTKSDFENIAWGLGFDETINVNSFQRLKSIFKETINEFSKAISDNRDYGIFRLDNNDIYFTGGETYGDDPTDSFQTFNRVACLPYKLRESTGIKF
jgi:hypothetical protein